MRQDRARPKLFQFSVNGEKDSRSIAHYIIGTLILAAITPLILVAGGIYYNYSMATKQRTLDYLKLVVDEHKNYIEVFLSERLSDLKNIAAFYGFEELRKKELLERLFMALQREHGAYVDLGVIDAKGNHLAYVGPYELTEKKYKGAVWFKEVMRKGTYISDMFTGHRGVPHIIIAIRASDGIPEWILRATIDPERLRSLVEGIRIGRTGEAYIVNRKGLYQTTPRNSPGGLMERADIADLTYFPGSRIQDINEAGGRRVLVVKSWLKGRDWLLVVKQGAHEAFAALYRVRNRAIIIFLIGGLTITLVVIFSTVFLVDRIDEAQEERDALGEQLLQAGKMAALGQIAAGVAHEINNPLAIIGVELGWIEDLMEDQKIEFSNNSNEFNNSLNIIKEEVVRCKNITHNLLTFARQEEALISETDINQLLEDTVRLIEKSAIVANITIIREFQKDLPLLFTDSSQLRQVFLNIFNNAIKAMSKGGEIRISTANEQSRIHIAISDTGIGIPEEDLTKIFEPFFTTREAGEGTGLGLAICFGIITKLGGEIGLESKPHQGTTFHIRLPLKKK